MRAALSRLGGWCAWVPAALFVLLCAPTVFSRPLAKGIDASMFYSIFHQMCQGRRLYADIFDMKDPLYFYAYAVAYGFIGLRGPMVWETILSIGMLLVLDRIMLRLGLSLIARVALLLLFVFLFFTPDVYMPIHTYHQSIFLFLAAVWAGMARVPFVAGSLMALVFFSKMPMVYMLPAAGWMVVFAGPLPRLKAVAKRLVWSALGFLGTMAVVLALLVARGEFWGYLDSVGVNVYYASLYVRRIIDPATFNKAVFLFGYGAVGAWLVLMAFDAVLACYHLVVITISPARRKLVFHHAHGLRGLEYRWHLLSLSLFSLLVSLGTLYTVSLGPKRSHHFQLVAVAVPICLIHLFCYLRLRFPRISLRLKALVVALLASAIVLFAPNESYTRQPVSRDALRGDALRFDKRFVAWRDIIARYATTSLTYAVVAQSNPGVRLPGLTPPSMRLICRTFFQYPWNDPKMMNELISLADEGRPDLFFRQRYFNQMPYYELQLDAALRRNYCVAETNGEVTIWRKWEGVGAQLDRSPRVEKPPAQRIEKAVRGLASHPTTVVARIVHTVWRRSLLPALAMDYSPHLTEGGTRMPTNTVTVTVKDLTSSDLDLLVRGINDDGIAVVRGDRAGYAAFKLQVAEPCGARLSVIYGAGVCSPFTVEVEDITVFTNAGSSVTSPGTIHTTKEVVLGDLYFTKPGVKHISLRSPKGPFPTVAGIVARACTVATNAPRR